MIAALRYWRPIVAAIALAAVWGHGALQARTWKARAIRAEMDAGALRTTLDAERAVWAAATLRHENEADSLRAAAGAIQERVVFRTQIIDIGVEKTLEEIRDAPGGDAVIDPVLWAAFVRLDQRLRDQAAGAYAVADRDSAGANPA